MRYLLAAVRGRYDDPSADRLDNQCDHLTSLPTRPVLDRRLRHAENRAREAGALYAVLFIDVDHFKSINDRNGHRAGDLVLQIVAERLRACVRPTDVVARYGGDEFVVLIDDVCVESEVEQIAARIRAELNRSIDIGGKREPMAASVGVAIAKPQSAAQDLVDEADQAMYRGKSCQADQRLSTVCRAAVPLPSAHHAMCPLPGRALRNPAFNEIND